MCLYHMHAFVSHSLVMLYFAQTVLLKISVGSQYDSPGSVILFIWEAEKGASKVQGQPGQLKRDPLVINRKEGWDIAK